MAFSSKKLITPPVKVEVKPTDADIENKKNLLSSLVIKYDEKEIHNLTKEELIDMVHKAKCGKLKGLDTKDMTKEDIMEHLIKSKCPEVHTMILELRHLREGLSKFVEKYVEDGRKITVDNIYYSGLADAIKRIFFYQAWKENRYDCILHHQDTSSYSNFSFRFEYGDKTQNNSYLKYIASKIHECVDKGVKVIAIPVSFDTFDGAHANAIIYRVDSNTFERFEPHGSKTGVSLKNPLYKDPKKAINRIAYIVNYILFSETYKYKHKGEEKEKRVIDALDEAYTDLGKAHNKWSKTFDKKKYSDKDREESVKQLANKIEELSGKADFRSTLMKVAQKLTSDANKEIFKELQLLDLQLTNPMDDTQKSIPGNEPLNEMFKELFTKEIATYDDMFIGAKYSSPDITNVATLGLQALEGHQIRKKFGKPGYWLKREGKLPDYIKPDDNLKYSERIGGFCVLWSVMYFDLVFRFPDATPAILNMRLLELLHKKGEYAFGELALGYLQGFKDFIDRYIGKIDYTKFSKGNKDEKDNASKALRDAIDKVVVF